MALLQDCDFLSFGAALILHYASKNVGLEHISQVLGKLWFELALVPSSRCICQNLPMYRWSMSNGTAKNEWGEIFKWLGREKSITITLSDPYITVKIEKNHATRGCVCVCLCVQCTVCNTLGISHAGLLIVAGQSRWNTLTYSQWMKKRWSLRARKACGTISPPLTSFFPNVVFLLCHITHSLCWTAHCFQISEHEIHTHTCTHAQNPFHNLVCFECWLYPIWLNESQYSLAWAQYVGMVTGKSWLPYKLSTAIGWVSGRICCLWI